MVEIIRSIEIKVEIDTNKQTISKSFDSFEGFLAWARGSEFLEENDRPKPGAKQREYVRLVDRMREVRDAAQEGSLSWSDAFEFVFSKGYSSRLKEMNMYPDYCDPDMDYEDDVKAFVSALDEKYDSSKQLLKLIDNYEDIINGGSHDS